MLVSFGKNPCCVVEVLLVVMSVNDNPPSGSPVALVNVPDEGVPNAPLNKTIAPALPVFTPSAVNTPVPVVVVEGDAPAPPPIIIALAVKSPDDAHVEVEEKYGIPPDVPATVNAGVVVGLATEINPPVKPTVVTVPLPVPAPIAVLKSEALSQSTVLSALALKKVIALGFVEVKILLPTVVAPKFVLAPAAVPEPVPPLAIAILVPVQTPVVIVPKVIIDVCPT